MSKQVLFRSALGGYNKKDVNQYLISKSNETKEILALKDAEIKELSSRLMKVEGLAEEKERILKQRVGESACGLKGDLAALKLKLDEVISLVDELDRAVEKGAENSSKAAKYDRLALTLGDMFSIDPKKEEFDAPEPADRSQLKKSLADSIEGLEKRLACLEGGESADC